MKYFSTCDTPDELRQQFKDHCKDFAFDSDCGTIDLDAYVQMTEEYNSLARMFNSMGTIPELVVYSLL